MRGEPEKCRDGKVTHHPRPETSGAHRVLVFFLPPHFSSESVVRTGACSMFDPITCNAQPGWAPPSALTNTSGHGSSVSWRSAAARVWCSPSVSVWRGDRRATQEKVRCEPDMIPNDPHAPNSRLATHSRPVAPQQQKRHHSAPILDVSEREMRRLVTPAWSTKLPSVMTKPS